ncbi:Acetylcholinesterase-1 [Halotydeus destructor]|nr:Acetylcholinesterase-1 [Halotydeus destructor]
MNATRLPNNSYNSVVQAETMRLTASLYIFLIFRAVDCVEVHTKLGTIRGQQLEVDGQRVNQYIGIPFAQPPVGRLRFAKPIAKSPWSPEILDTSQNRTVNCIDSAVQGKRYVEDCLYLNIWTPGNSDSSKLLPVYMYMFGGGFELKENADYGSNGSYPVRHDVVLVFPNYRLNAFGFFNANQTDAPGNQGIWDQVMAFKWVADNIEAFGGDADRLTFFGHSAGGTSALIHLLSPVTKHYLSRAIILSGTNAIREPSLIMDNSLKLASLLNCSGSSYVNCLRGLKANKVRQIAITFPKASFFPNYGDEIIPLQLMPALRQIGIRKDVPVLTGSTQLEYQNLFQDKCETIANYQSGSGQTLTQADVKACLEAISLNSSISDEVMEYYFKDIGCSDSATVQTITTKINGHLVFVCPTYFVSQAIARRVDSSNVYSYFLSYGTKKAITICQNVTWPRPCHGDELHALFGDPFIKPRMYNSTDRPFSTSLIQLWSQFGKTGQPPLVNGKQWPAYQEKPKSSATAETQSQSQGKSEKPIWPSYVEINPLKPQGGPVYHPYTDCDQFWSKHLEIFDRYTS